jgi:hypothetical protein
VLQSTGVLRITPIRILTVADEVLRYRRFVK